MFRERELAKIVVMLAVISFASGCVGKTVEFPDLKERLLVTSADAKNPGAPFTPKDCPDCLFNVVNRTGQAWTDFHLEARLGNGPDGTFGFMDQASGGFDGDVYEGDGTDALSNNNHTLDITGINIADGGTFSFNVDIGDLELQGTWELYGRPTVQAR
jgi:hypothetical protein